MVCKKSFKKNPLGQGWIFYWFHYTHYMNNTITWEDFESVELRVGTVIRVEDFPEARKPAYKLWVDFG